MKYEYSGEYTIKVKMNILEDRELSTELIEELQKLQLEIKEKVTALCGENVTVSARNDIISNGDYIVSINKPYDEIERIMALKDN